MAQARSSAFSPLVSARPTATLAAQLMAFATVARQRRALARLDDAALQDMGLTRHEVSAEVARPFWDVPVHWKG